MDKDVVKTHLPIDRQSFEDYLSFDLPSLTWSEKCYQCLLYLSIFPENGSGLTSYHEEYLEEVNTKIAGVKLKALAYLAAGGPSFLSGVSTFLGTWLFAACFWGGTCSSVANMGSVFFSLRQARAAAKAEDKKQDLFTHIKAIYFDLAAYLLRLYVHATPFEDISYNDRVAEALGYKEEELAKSLVLVRHLAKCIDENISRIQKSIEEQYPAESKEIIRPLQEVAYFIKSSDNSSHKRKLVDVALRNEEKTLRAEINFRIEITKRELINSDLLARVAVLEDTLLQSDSRSEEEQSSIIESRKMLELSKIANMEMKTWKKSSSYDDLYALSLRRDL